MINYWEKVEIDKTDESFVNLSISEIYSFYSRRVITKINYFRNKLLTEGKDYNSIVIPTAILNLISSDVSLNPSFVSPTSNQSYTYIGSLFGMDVYYDQNLDKETIYFTNSIQKIRENKIDNILNGTVSQSDKLFVKLIINSDLIM
jgi:hypothetical protein